ncbi:MAG: EamA family transporter RarD [Bacteriovoracaceae bacterium]|nr:EamA family transporter RarD [Bacteriovoracaceae bacterium]
MSSFSSEQRKGVIFALSAYLIWGLLALYLKQIKAASPFEILIHRVLWGTPICLILLWHQKKMKETLTVFFSAKIKWLALSSFLIATNWLIYIWAINNSHMLQVSLGYYINPLLNVLLAVIFLKERMQNLQKIALLFALLGVSIFAVKLSVLPLIALSLAISFGLYGLIRKMAPVDSLIGLSIEVFLLLPFCLAGLFWFLHTGELKFGHDLKLSLLLPLSGPLAVFSLLLFVAGARRIRYSTMGVLQYISPTCNFLLAVFLYGEIFTITHAVTFSLIWIGVILYLTSMRRLRITQTT